MFPWLEPAPDEGCVDCWTMDELAEEWDLPDVVYEDERLAVFDKQWDVPSGEECGS